MNGSSSIRALLFMACYCLLGTDARAAPRLNVVLILFDDFGYECVAANGGTSYRTPHLDKLGRLACSLVAKLMGGSINSESTQP